MTFPVITERLYLRRFTQQDLIAYREYHCQPEVYRYLYAHPPEPEHVASQLSNAISSSLNNDGDTLYYAVVLKDSPTLIGEVLLKLANQSALQAEIGYIFNPAYAGKGYATEAVAAVLAQGFTEGGFQRIFARLDAENQGSIGIVERLGMRKEAHFRQNDRFNDRWGDELVYALLRSEYLSR